MTTHPILYEQLARAVLWRLIEGGQLVQAEPEGRVAYHLYHLPPAITLKIPARERFYGLINPNTQAAEADALAKAILALARGAERDTWRVGDMGCRVTVQLAQGRRVAAEAHYEVASLPAPRPRRRPKGEPLLQVTMGGREEIFTSGQGLLPLLAGWRHPRTLLIEDVYGDAEGALGWLWSEGVIELRDAGGRSERVEPYTRAAISHDTQFSVRGRRWRPWQRRTEGKLALLGESRARRPALDLAGSTLDLHWERNERPRFDLADADGRPRVRLIAKQDDAVEIENLTEDPMTLRWFDGRPLLLLGASTLPLQGRHLRGVSWDGVERFSADLDPGTKRDLPTALEVHGVVVADPLGSSLQPALFGFEAPQATIFQDGLRLDTTQAGQALNLPVGRDGQQGALFKIALDGCEGCKILPLTTLHLEGAPSPLPRQVWRWVRGVTRLHAPGLAVRIEAVSGVRLFLENPAAIGALSADPDDCWRLAGWRLHVRSDGLEVSGRGRAAMLIDHVEVNAPCRLPPRPVHHVEAAGLCYRIVRRAGVAPSLEARG